MAVSPTSNIQTLLKHFATKQNNGIINFLEFCDYMKRYAQKYVEEQEDLIQYVANPQEAVSREVALLSDDKKAIIINPDTDKKSIVVTSFFIEKFSNRYMEIQNNPVIPFPTITDLPKHLTAEIYKKRLTTDFIFELLENQKINDENLYGLTFPRDLPIVLLPSTVSVNTLIDISVSKIRTMLRKDEFHDYFLKKIRISNPGKELSAKTFFQQVVLKPVESLETLKNSGDTFYFWSQLCYFIRQDYEKVKDCTQEDIAILQAVNIIELATSFFKKKSQQDQQRTTALKNLEIILNKPPYYFSKDAIAKFVDSRGIPLLGQYSQDDLNEWLHTATTSLEKNNLPSLLVFKVESGQLFFISKTKVIPLIVRLISDTRENVKDSLTKEWYSIYKNFETVPAMKEQKAFEIRLEQSVKSASPVLYALLNSNFLSLVHYETRTSQEPVAERINLFTNGKLIPYSELLMISRQEIITDAKILLPFWYTVPIISWIASLLFKKPTKKKNKAQENKTSNSDENEQKEKSEKSGKNSKKDELKNAAETIEQALVPEGSTLDRELNSYLLQWNKQIDKVSRANLTEDVNSLIRDYLRATIKSLRAASFTIQRIHELSVTLAKTPSLQKIRDTDQLTMYIQLYMVKLVKNL